MDKKAKKNRTQTLICKSISRLRLGLSLLLTIACVRFDLKHSVKEEKTCTPEKLNNISTHPTPLANEATRNQVDHNGKTMLHIAAENGDLSRVELLINDSETDVNATCKGGKTALYFASEKNKIKVVELLINCERIDLNKPTDYGNTPLHIVSRLGYLEIAKVLVKANGILVNAKNDHTETPLYVAWQGHEIEESQREECNREGCHRKILELLWNDPRNECDKFCSICLETICLETICRDNYIYITRCLHCFHRECMQACQYHQTNHNKTCPNCRQPIQSI